MIVVAVGREAGVNELRPASRGGNPINPAAGVVDQGLAVFQPVWRLNPHRDDVDDGAGPSRPRVRVSRTAASTARPDAGGSGAVSSRFENTASSVTSLSWEQTPIPT